MDISPVGLAGLMSLMSGPDRRAARVVPFPPAGYDEDMSVVRIRFSDSQTEARALGFLAGRFSFTSWESGETLIPDTALAALALESISFTVVGPPNYAQAIPALRTAPADQLQ
jgi:hypothetical protein